MAGHGGITAEFLSKGGEAMVMGLKRIFNVCLNVAKRPEDWRGAYIVPLYIGK